MIKVDVWTRSKKFVISIPSDQTIQDAMQYASEKLEKLGKDLMGFQLREDELYKLDRQYI